MNMHNLSNTIFSIETLIIAVSCILTFIACKFSKQISERFGTLDHPGGRKTHENATPLMGGLVICSIVIPLMTLIVSIFPFSDSVRTLLFTIGTASLGIAFIGILDDRQEVDPKIRLIYGLVVFSAVIAINPTLVVQVLKWSSVLPPMGFSIFSGAVTVFAFLVLLNAVNMADGKNGLVIGLSAGWAAIIMSYLPAAYTLIMAVILAALIVLFMFNMRGLIFLGDGGAYGFATLIGLLAVHLYTMPDSQVAADSIALLFGIPAVDMLRLMFTRWSHGQSPLSADRDHFHHHLQDFFGWPGGLFFYLVLVLVPCLIDRLVPGYGLLLLALVMLTYSAMVLRIHSAKKVRRAERA